MSEMNNPQSSGPELPEQLPQGPYPGQPYPGHQHPGAQVQGQPSPGTQQPGPYSHLATEYGGGVPAGYVTPDGRWVPAHLSPLSEMRDAPTQGWALHYGRRDTGLLITYALTMVLGLVALVLLLAYRVAGRELDSTSPMDGALANALSYALLTLVLLVFFRADIKEAAKTFSVRPGLKWGLIPAFFLGNLLVLSLAGVLVQLLTGGEAESTANQSALQEMTSEVPFLLMAIPTVIMAPLLEEYIFRNILIGKLSYKLNTWACLAVSSLAFMLIHALAGWPENPLSLLPYLVMGINFGLIYIWSGKSFLYSAVIHGLHNLMALSLLYLVPNLPV